MVFFCGTSQVHLYQKFIVNEEDLAKRPSDMEIIQKDLPHNTPTLRQRQERDHTHMFYQKSKHSGYTLGPTGTWRDAVDPNMTYKEFLKIGSSQFIKECKKLNEERKDINSRQDYRPRVCSGNKKYHMVGFKLVFCYCFEFLMGQPVWLRGVTTRTSNSWIRQILI